MGVYIDGYGRERVIVIAQSIPSGGDTGPVEGNYSGNNQQLTTTENTIAVAKVGPIAEIYDPEFAALLSGEL